MPELRESIIKNHMQIYENTSAQSAVEMVLKSLDLYPENAYFEQDKIDHNTLSKSSGYKCSLHFICEDITKFNNDVDLEFNCIDSELDAGRYVIVELDKDKNPDKSKREKGNVCYVIYAKVGEEYKAFSKLSIKQHDIPVIIDNVKAWIEKMEGADILIYESINILSHNIPA